MSTNRMEWATTPGWLPDLDASVQCLVYVGPVLPPSVCVLAASSRPLSGNDCDGGEVDEQRIATTTSTEAR